MSNSSDPTGGAPVLPPSLDLPPHLSAQKYFFVCTLTVAAWDTLVLSPRSYRLLRTKEWPLLKIAYHFLRVFMPIEFTIVGVAFFDTKWSQAVSSFIFCPHVVRLCLCWLLGVPGFRCQGAVQSARLISCHYRSRLCFERVLFKNTCWWILLECRFA